MKEQTRNKEVQTNEEEIGIISGKELRIMVNKTKQTNKKATKTLKIK